MNVHSKKKRLRFLFNLSNGKVEIPSIERKKLNNTELLPSISDSGTRLNGNFKSTTHNEHFSLANDLENLKGLSSRLVRRPLNLRLRPKEQSILSPLQLLPILKYALLQIRQYYLPLMVLLLHHNRKKSTEVCTRPQICHSRLLYSYYLYF